ncbi:hypothetical protein UNDYM_3436 [Undibacterium sp. YM2]|uniref:hypothetical protein n=1 Tax=Undibacterium sp. YM2 TaxID=2058625 RepID=UPI001331CCF5|nr:hypothetical protein [Undibacterium sp. YM2]BBB67689.1 hypothetical protein UNDYM_3436 [Undibacterium sp. YM2]
MPNSISSKELLQYRNALDSGQMTTVQFYQNMLKKGYMYAGWAGGVAAGDEFAGIAALDYLKKSAADGAGGHPSKVVTDNDIANIRRDMAYAYLTAMEKIASEGNGIANRDVNFFETEDFHKEVFEKNGFSIDNWTLKIPMDLIKKQAVKLMLRRFGRRYVILEALVFQLICRILS